MSKRRIPIAVLLVAAAVSGCDKPAAPAAQARPVRTITVQQRAAGEIVSLTGQVRPKDQTDLGFRLDGRVVERSVRVGDRVAEGQVIARLDPQIQQNAVRSAEGNLSSLQAQLREASITFWRQQQLLKDGWTSRASFDKAQHIVETLQANVDAARAQLHTAQEQLAFTKLVADGAGVVTKVGAQPGEVISPGRMVVRIARDGGRDAVFDVPGPLMQGPHPSVVEIALTSDSAVKATGQVREVSPQADAITRTFQVKVGIINPPEAMRLGATVTGRITLSAPPGIEIPASALAKTDAGPAVWVVDPRSQTVTLRSVGVLRYDPATVVVSQGLETGDRVVTAGAQTLRPEQKVQIAGGL
jgi:membrane fusion protein, multidrug efflux system